MQPFLAAIVVLISTSGVLSLYRAEEHLVPKHGLESRHSIAKRDLSEADMEMILKALMSKMEHKTTDTEMMHKKIAEERGYYSYEPEIAEKTHYAHVNEEEMKHATKSYPVQYGYVKGSVPHEESGYDMKKGVDIAEKDAIALNMKMKELGMDKNSRESYSKTIYLETPEEKFVSEKMHLFKDSVPDEHSSKVHEDVLKDQFSDIDASMAESLYHMKIAGDVETYPNIKMERMYDKKMVDEKLSLDKGSVEESYLKKIDEMGKTLMKEEHFEDGDIEAYLKKAVEEEKAHFYDPKIVHTEGALKSAEEKALEAWKAGHKDVFAVEKGHLDEKFLKGGAHNIEEGIDEEFIKKLKELGVSAEFGKEHDELLHALAGEFHKEEGISHEINEEFIKKLKSLDLGAELGKEHGEHLHTLAGEFHKEDVINHGIDEELIKKLKSLNLSTLSAKDHDELLHVLAGEFHKDGISHEIDEELIKKLKSLDLGALSGKGHDELLHILEGEFHKEEGIAHKIDEELIKKLKSLDFGAKSGKEHAELPHILEGEFHKEVGIEHGINEEAMKKLKALGLDLSKEHEELLHTLSGEFHKEGIDEGSRAYEKAKEQAHKDAHIHLNEEEMKKHVDEALAFGSKEKTLGSDLLFEKGSAEAKFHGIGTKIGAGVDKSLHGIATDEAFKSKALDKAYGFELDKAKFDSKIPAIESDFKHGVSHDIAHEFAAEEDKTFKAHTEEFWKKGKVHGTDSLLHKAHEDELLNKEKAYGSDVFHKTLEGELLKKDATYGTDAFFHKAQDEELLKKEKAFDMDSAMHKAHEDELIKKDIAYGTDSVLHKGTDILEAADDHHAHVDKSHKSFRDLKAKFFELLRRVLHSRKCHLVTMRPGELLGIVNCVSRSKDPLLCEKFAACEKKMPPRVIAALEKCQKETIPGEVKKCTRYAPLYPSAEIPLRIFQCVAINTRELIPEEQKKMIEFEECARAVKAESCARFKFLPH